MLKKVFILTQFGTPHSWTQEFIDSVQFLEQYGWYWKIFTPNAFQSKGNVEIIPTTIEDFNKLCVKTLDINPLNKLTEKGVPSKAMSDFYIASGVIFADWLKDADYWGITNWDIVYGRLDHYLTDEELSKYEVWSDDVNIINGIFSLYKNTEKVNNLFRDLDHWVELFTTHKLFGTDEYGMTKIVRNRVSYNDLTFGYPKYYPYHSYDRLEQHFPVVKLERKDDNSLWERFLDMAPPPGYVHFPKGYIAKEIMYFHFIRTKSWPIL